MKKKSKERFWDKELTRVALAVLCTRVAVLILSYIFYLMKEPQGSLALFGTWLKQAGDVPHYLRIAESGYSVGDEFENLIVFYPLFPMLIKVLRCILRDYFISGLVISNVSAVIGSCYFYKLVRLDYPKSVARDTVTFFLLYPFSFFMSFCYTESLFLLLCLMCVYYARRSRWAVCGVTGFLAALCRTQGVVMFGVAAYEYIFQAREQILPDRGQTPCWEKLKLFFKKLSPQGLCLLLIPAGYVLYLGLNKYLFGDWFRFLEFQKAAPWYQEAGFFVENLQQQMNMAVNNPGLAYIIYIPQIVVFLVAFLLVFVGVKYKVRTSYLLHMAAYTMASYMSTWLISGGRYMLSCFMMFLPMGLLARNKIWRIVLLAVSGGLYFMMFYLYIKGYAIM